MTNPDDVGRWEGETFVFFEPHAVVTTDGVIIMEKLHLADVAYDSPDITKEDVIHAVVNSVMTFDDE